MSIAGKNLDFKKIKHASSKKRKLGVFVMLFLQINFDIAFFFVCSFFSVHGDSRVDTAEASPNESQDRRYRSDAGFDGKQIKMNHLQEGAQKIKQTFRTQIKEYPLCNSYR